jgi:hypothetical protein
MSLLLDKQYFIIRKITVTTLRAYTFIQSHQAFLLRWGAICGAVALAPLFGILVTRMEPILILAAAVAPIGLVGLQYILPRPELAPVLILFAALFLPIELPTGTESRLVDSLLLTLFFTSTWVTNMIIIEKRFSLRPSPANRPLMALMISILFTLLWSIVFRDPLVTSWKSFPIVQTASAITMIMLPGAFLLVANHINDLKLLKIMVALVLAAGAISAVSWLGRIDFSLVNDGGMFSMLIVGVSAGLAFFIREMVIFRRVLLLMLTAAWIYIRFVLGITWLAGWLPSMIILGLLSFRRSKLFFFTLLALGLIFILINADYYLGTVLADETDESGHTRMAAWEVNWRVTSKHLLFGTGPAGYAAYYMSYYPKEGMATHNSFMDVLAQTGLVGTFFVLWFFFALIWQGARLCRRLQGRGDFAEAMANVALGVTVANLIMMGFGDWLFPFAYTQTIAGFDYAVYSWLFMGVVPLLDHLTKEHEGNVGLDNEAVTTQANGVLSAQVSL